MAPFMYPGYQRQYRDDEWQCYGCHKWFPMTTAHGCSYKKIELEEQKESLKEKQLRFLIDRRNEQIKRYWKKEQYAKVKGQFRV